MTAIGIKSIKSVISSGFFVSLAIHYVLHALFPACKQKGTSPFALKLHRKTVHQAAEMDSVQPTMHMDGVEVISCGLKT